MSHLPLSSGRSAPVAILIKKVLTVAYLLVAQNHHFTTSFATGSYRRGLLVMRARLPRKAHFTTGATPYSDLVKEDIIVADEVKTEPTARTTSKRGIKAELTAATIVKTEIEAETIVATKASKKRIKADVAAATTIKEEIKAEVTVVTTIKNEIEAEIIAVSKVKREIKSEVAVVSTTNKVKKESSNSSSSNILIDLGDLTTMVVVARPSASIKTPYVADLIMKTAEYRRADFTVKIEGNSSCSDSTPKKADTKKVTKKQENDSKIALSNALRLTVQPEDIHLGHTPALDCAGMIVPGAVVYCTVNGGHTKSKYTVQFCEEQREDGGIVTVACHPNLAERAARVLLEEEYLTEELGLYDAGKVLRQQTFGNSRVDFVIQNEEENSITLVEVKNVVGADYQEGSVPPGRSPIGVYSVPMNIDGSVYKRHAIFPHGCKKAEVGVVSDRAIKHIHELTCMQGTVDSQGRNIKSAILFIINRSDCEAFRPCHEADMMFAQMLLRAQQRGVNIIAKEVIWTNGIGLAGRSLPISFDKSVTSNIDEEHLLKVLLFNENGSGRTPPPSKKKIKEENEENESEDEKPKKAVVKKRKIKKEESEDEDEDDEEDDEEEDEKPKKIAAKKKKIKKEDD